MVCGPLQVCSNRVCTSECLAAQSLCTPDGGAPYCADLQSDNANCGSCGNVCPGDAGATCGQGVCAATCGSGLSLCTPDAGAPYCANLLTDNANCGACDRLCSPGEACAVGQCAVSCGAGLTNCGGACTNADTDPYNCGACGVVCNQQACLGGTCVFPGTTGTSWATATTPPGVVYNGGFSDYTPPGSAGFYLYASSLNIVSVVNVMSATSGGGGGGTTVQGFAQYVPAPDGGTDSWNILSTPPSTSPIVGDFGAWVGGNLYGFGAEGVMAFGVDAGTWTTPLTVTTNVAKLSQHAHDDSGNIYAMTTTGDIFEYMIGANAGAALGVGSFSAVYAPRLAWDSVSRLLYVAPNLGDNTLYSIDVTTGQLASLSSISVSSTMARAFCADRSGHLYAGTTDGNIWQYTIADDTWVSINPNPFSVDPTNSACTVSDEGFLYYTDGTGDVRMLPILPGTSG